MAKTKGQNYLYGAAILTAGVAIMKVLGFIYKMPIGNIIGDDGYSMFIETYNVYNVFLTLATAGLPIALSRLISEANAEGRVMQARRTFSVAWWSFMAIGLICTLIMFLCPRYIACHILVNPPAETSIRAMAPAVLLVCLVSAYRGYCQGYGNMIPTTVGQVLEVLVKVVVGLALAAFIMRTYNDKALGSAGAIFGVTVGSAAALLYMWAYKRRNYKYEPVEDPDTPDSCFKIFKHFMRIGVPIALGSSVLALLNLVDSGLCMGRLQSAAGFSLGQAQVLYGVYGKAQTLFNLPAAFITPLTISVVPAISAAIVRGEGDRATRISEDSLRIATVICLPMGVGIAVLCRPIMRVIYPNSHLAGPTLLCIMGIASFFVCLVLIENAVLQASGREMLPMYSMIVGGFVKVAVNWFLVARPEINIYGAPIGTLVSYVVMCVMNYIFMGAVMEKRPRIRAVALRPGLCAAVMGACAWGVYGICQRFLGAGDRLHMLLCLAVAIAAAALVYLLCVILLKTVTREDMSLIPGGERLAKALHMG